MKIVVDAFGGDNAPLEIVEGVVLALEKNKNLEVVLCGKQDTIKEILNGREERVEIVDAQEIIENTDHPTEAIRKKKDSSLVRAFDVLKEREDVVGLVSAGSTGAILAGAIMKIGRIKGISRPALAPILPTKKDSDVIIIEGGANVDCKPINLLHFALMGSAYYSIIYNTPNPRVALLSNGAEEGKGNELVKETFPLLKDAPINFIGNKEGGDFMSGDVDVMVADGFAGNVLLKGTEGAVKAVLSILKKSIKDHALSKIGALFMKKTFDEIKNRVDVQGKHAGSPFLGCKKLVVKNHGGCDRNNICASIEQTMKLHENHLIEEIENSLAKINVTEGAE
ncbi:MAG: phosphate acyltransferase PlsX [Clostridia bacterium]|nr:phosphate acyltransferase PlsX [Clostridia bacterium]